MWCLIGCYVCWVKWLALFLSFFERLYRSHLHDEGKNTNVCQLRPHNIHKVLLDFWSLQKKRKKKYKILFWVIKLFFKVTENKNVQFISPSYLCLKVTRTFSGVSFFTLVQYVQQRLQCIMYTVLAAPLASTPDSDFANLCVSQQMGANTRFVKCLQRWIITFPVLSLSYWHDNTLSY